MLKNWIRFKNETITKFYFCFIFSIAIYDLKYILIYKIQKKKIGIN